MTRWEREEWIVSPRRGLHVFETDFGKLAVAICYDVEFPEIARAAGRSGCDMLVVPSCTDDRQGFLRVRYCAQARAIENQMYVVQACTVGSLPMVPAVSLNYGQASILTPSDFRFSRDGILAEGQVNSEMMVLGDLDSTRSPLARARHGAAAARQPVDGRGAGAAPGGTPLIPQVKRDLVLRHLRRADFAGVIDLCKRVYPESVPWKRAQLASHLRVFPEGQLVVVERASGRIVGLASSLILRWDDYDFDADWREWTAGGTFTNHDPEHGRTLYGAEVMVDPAMQRRGIGKWLYAARRDLVRRLGLRRIRAGARLRGYHRHAKKMSPEEYAAKVVRGELRDPTLSFQLREGFDVIAVVGSYLRHDPESLGYAAIIEWLNPELATPEDLARRDPRYRRPEST
jgi:GNAT superfamily N-acetyltransferase